MISPFPDRTPIVEHAPWLVTKSWTDWYVQLKDGINALITQVAALLPLSTFLVQHNADGTHSAVTATTVTASSQMLAPNGTTSVVAYAFVGDPDTGLGHVVGADILELYTNGLPRVLITTSGIGVTLPTFPTADNSTLLGLNVLSWSKTYGGTFVGRVVAPAALGASQNNYNPTGLATAYVLALSASTPVNLTGLDATGAEDGRPLILSNIGVNTITLTHDDGASTANNRFFFHDAANRVLSNGRSVTVHRNPSLNNRWVLTGA